VGPIESTRSGRGKAKTKKNGELDPKKRRIESLWRRGCFAKWVFFGPEIAKKRKSFWSRLGPIGETVAG